MLDSLRSPVLEMRGNQILSAVPLVAGDRCARLSASRATSVPFGAAIGLHIGVLLLLTSAMTSRLPVPPPAQELHVEMMKLPSKPLPAPEAVEPVVNPAPAVVVPPAPAESVAFPPAPVPPPSPEAVATPAATAIARVEPEPIPPVPAIAAEQVDQTPISAVPPPPTQSVAPALPRPVTKRVVTPQQPLVRHNLPIVAGDAVVRDASVPPRSSAGDASVTSPTPPARSAPASAEALADVETRLEARIRDAVQQAVQYPASARMMGLTGRARVLLDYFGGRVESPSLAQSSGAPVLDSAAIAAARTANYPKPPAELEGRRLRFLVWVEFRAG